MRNPKSILQLLTFLIFTFHVAAQNTPTREINTKLDMKRQVIRIPNIPGYTTLKCDLHMHTIFSDGDVWPTVRVHEAYYEGLDVIAISDHIENEPRKKYIGGDGNAPYEIAHPEAEKYNIMLIKAGEITRSMPPGHINALFLDDVSKLDTENYMDAIQEANKQGAFLMWNHPAWPQVREHKNKGFWEVHKEMLSKGWLHGIEVFNMEESFPEAMDWCAENNLAFMASSDVHKVASYDFDYNKYLRPMTLVFVNEPSQEGVKEALFAKRTVAFFTDHLAGPENLLRELFNASLVVKKPFRIQGNKAFFQLENPTDLCIVLQNESPEANAPKEITIRPGSSVIVSCALQNGKAELPYKVANFLVGKDKALSVILSINK